jgi:AraC-like DNA-binding protein
MLHPPLVNNPTQYWDSTDHEDYSRARTLQSILSSSCNVQTKIENRNVEARLHYRAVGDYGFADAEYRNYQSFKQSTEMDNGITALLLMKKGQMVMKTELSEYLLSAGDFFLGNNLASARFESVGLVNLQLLILPTRSLAPIPSLQRQNLQVFQQPTGAGSLLTTYVSGLFQQIQNLDGATVAALMKPTAELIYCASSLNESVSESTKGKTKLMDIKAYIDKNIKDPDLSPSLIAEQHGISIRHLHTLFEKDGSTVGTWIKRARIEGCKIDLVRTTKIYKSITDIAFEWGFNDLSTFCRQFKQTTGLSARDYTNSL